MREAVGDEIELCFDIHTRLDPPDAIWLCHAVEPYRPFFMEDPIRSESMQTLRVVREHVSAPLAVGRAVRRKWEFRQLIEEELIDYARIDLCIAGGFTEAKKIAGWCETHYIKLATHNPLGPISSAACLHLNLACTNFGVQEQPRRPGTVLTDVVPVQMEWADGYLLPPTAPAWGSSSTARRRKPIPSRCGSCHTWCGRTDHSLTGKGSDPGGGGQEPGVTSSDHHSRVPASRRRTSATRSTQGPGTGCPTREPRAEGGLVS